ncbi:MAG: dihydrodipicolinate reductase [Phycisphaerae bacterium]
MHSFIVIGLGPIGLAVARHIAASPELNLVGLVDLDPAKVGRTLPEILGPGVDAPEDGPVVVDQVRKVEAADFGEADAAVVCTTSYFDAIVPTLRDVMKGGLPVVTSCEEMTWPWYRHKVLADQVNGECEQEGVAMLATGVNPGWVMDLFPVQVSQMLNRVTRVRCTRVVDVLSRRRPLQVKVGSGMKPAAFEKLAAGGKIGHKGIAESVCVVAHGLGHNPLGNSVKVGLRPVLADAPTDWPGGRVEPGDVRGMHNTAHWTDGQITIDLDLTMALAEPNPRDEIELWSDELPGGKLTLQIPGGTPGDTATAAALVNAARHVPALEPGLRTVLDLPGGRPRG